MSKRNAPTGRDNWSFNVLGAISLFNVEGLWVLEGSTDHIVFHYFLEQVAKHLKSKRECEGSRIDFQIDNARPHHNPEVLRQVAALGVDIVFNARYSPQLNSVEMLWHRIKMKLRAQPPAQDKRQFVTNLLQAVSDVDHAGTRSLWRYAVSNWLGHINSTNVRTHN